MQYIFLKIILSRLNFGIDFQKFKLKKYVSEILYKLKQVLLFQIICLFFQIPTLFTHKKSNYYRK